MLADRPCPTVHAIIVAHLDVLWCPDFAFVVTFFLCLGSGGLCMLSLHRAPRRPSPPLAFAGLCLPDYLLGVLSEDLSSLCAYAHGCLCLGCSVCLLLRYCHASKIPGTFSGAWMGVSFLWVPCRAACFCGCPASAIRRQGLFIHFLLRLPYADAHLRVRECGFIYWLVFACMLTRQNSGRYFWAKTRL